MIPPIRFRSSSTANQPKPAARWHRTEIVSAGVMLGLSAATWIGVVLVLLRAG